MADGSYPVTFTIYDAAAVGNFKWTETQNVTTIGGLFSVIRGSINPILDTVFNGTTRYLGITVGGDSEMTPMTALISVPYAQRVNTIDGATGGNITSRVSIGPGHTNTGADAFVAGDANIASGDLSTVGGGTGHEASGMFSTIGGGRANFTDATSGTGGGGIGNIATGTLAPTVAGGESNTASASRATVGGGSSNIADNDGATVGGGRNNRARGQYSVVAGASNADSNLAGNIYATVSGGHKNIASAPRSAIGGGKFNTASSSYSVVAGGYNNLASGQYSAVTGGESNEASGAHSFAGGRRAKASHKGSFVWGDSFDGDVTSSTNNQFTARASGGVRFFSNSGLTTGVTLASGGGAWAAVSDSTVKANIRPVDGDDILEKISELEITRWNYETQDASIEHIGPMAQDFYRLFGVGDNNTTITTIDPDGISLAAIKALIKKNEKLESEVAELRKIVQELVANQD